MSTAQKTSYVDQAPVLLVSPSGVTRPFGYGASTDSDRGAALEAAVTAAATGDLVKMTCAATYHTTAALVPAEGVTIQGLGPQSTLIKRDNTGIEFSNGGMAINVFYDDITLRGFSVSCTGTGMGYDSASDPVPDFAGVTGLLIEDVWVDAKKDAFMLFGQAYGSTATVRRCRLLNTFGSELDLLVDLTLGVGGVVLFEDCYLHGQNDADLLLSSLPGEGRVRLTNCTVNGAVVNDSGTFETLNSTAGTWDGTFTRLDQPAGITLGAAGRALMDDTTAAAARTTLGLHQRVLQLVLGGPSDDMVTGDAQASFTVPSVLNGAVITGVMASVVTAGTTGTAEIALRRSRSGSAVDVLSTDVTIDTTETNSTTAATPAVINTSNDDLATGDILLVDVDAVHSGTAAKGAALTLTLTL